MKKIGLLVVGIFLLFSSCQHNDICIEDAPTTPKLKIQFFDSNHHQRPKSVENFNVRELNSTPYYFENGVNDTVASIPLRTDQTETVYELIIHTDSVNEVIDTLRLTYQNHEVFISRACGFRDEFTDFNAQLIDSSNTDTWIKDLKTPIPNTITDEKTTHLYIYH